jgi:adenylosuccinate lyase
MARMLRGYATTALENVALWHERDISHSAPERVMLPDCCILLHFMLTEIIDLIQTLQVYPANMERNLFCYGGVVFSQQVLLALVNKGMSRDESYRLVQKYAHQAWNNPTGNFRQLIENDPIIQQHLTPDEIARCFDPQAHLKHLDEIYQRLGI